VGLDQVGQKRLPWSIFIPRMTEVSNATMLVIYLPSGGNPVGRSI
ncbi:unnamed protein product, partial [Acidithrix sp. C25]